MERQNKSTSNSPAEPEVNSARDLASTCEPTLPWLQIKGDPSIREQVFQQTRKPSEFDRQVERVLKIVERLFIERGVFHVIVHFSSNQLTCWFLNDPFRYKVFVGSTVLDDGFVDSFPEISPWIGAYVNSTELNVILQEFKRLRLRDEHLYLRNGSLNIINGMVGLSFSCDGTHYIVADEFQRFGHLI
jgi:hypothetical protein